MCLNSTWKIVLWTNRSKNNIYKILKFTLKHVHPLRCIKFKSVFFGNKMKNSNPIQFFSNVLCFPQLVKTKRYRSQLNGTAFVKENLKSNVIVILYKYSACVQFLPGSFSFSFRARAWVKFLNRKVEIKSKSKKKGRN